jgi:hypothetical protein
MEGFDNGRVYQANNSSLTGETSRSTVSGLVSKTDLFLQTFRLDNSFVYRYLLT